MDPPPSLPVPLPPASSPDISDSLLPEPSSRTSSRLSLPLPLRLPLYILVSSAIGFGLGVKKGSQDSGFRFRAEHAHRLPTTQAGWYLYHKSKNYNSMLGGIYEGFRMGWRLAPWAGVFVLVEEGVDRGRGVGVREWRSHRTPSPSEALGVDEGEMKTAGNKDFVSTMLAGLVSAGLFAGWKGMPLPTAVRLMKLGAKGGLAFGLMQDAMGLLRGRRLGYVEFIKRHTFGTGEEEGEAVGAVG